MLTIPPYITVTDQNIAHYCEESRPACSSILSLLVDTTRQGNNGPKRVAPETIQGLIDQATDTKLGVDARIAALDGLREKGKAAAGADPQLKALMSDPNFKIRRYAAQTLVAVTNTPRTTLRYFENVLKDRAARVEAREAACYGLGEVGKNGVSALVDLGLKDSSPSVRYQALINLRDLNDAGVNISGAQATVTKLTTDRNRNVAGVARQIADRLQKNAGR